VHGEMAAYRLYTVTPRLLRFIEDLTNWCVREEGGREGGSGE
jgi:isoleucyl-tRNA synthetase